MRSVLFKVSPSRSTYGQYIIRVQVDRFFHRAKSIALLNRMSTYDSETLVSTLAIQGRSLLLIYNRHENSPTDRVSYTRPGKHNAYHHAFSNLFPLAFLCCESRFLGVPFADFDGAH